MPHHRAADFSLWTGRAEKDSQRFFQRVSAPKSPEILGTVDRDEFGQRADDRSVAAGPTLALLGYADDEGVRRNLGRPGAMEGPEAIRRCLAGLAVHDRYHVVDYGNVGSEGRDLAGLQDWCAEWVRHRRGSGEATLIFGGGHDVAFAHGLGHMRHLQTSCSPCRLLVVNFDAHFDLREPVPAGGHSGSPFLQLLNEAEACGFALDYGVLGVQPASNHSALFRRAEQKQVFWHTADELNQSTFNGRNSVILQSALERADAVYLTVCLDVFQHALAPGVSAPQPLGLGLAAFLPLFDCVLASGKVVGFDVAELNPAFDRDNQTARLAASLVVRALESGLGRFNRQSSKLASAPFQESRPC
jgi:formiminoglutamase